MTVDARSCHTNHLVSGQGIILCRGWDWFFLSTAWETASCRWKTSIILIQRLSCHCVGAWCMIWQLTPTRTYTVACCARLGAHVYPNCMLADRQLTKLLLWQSWTHYVLRAEEYWSQNRTCSNLSMFFFIVGLWILQTCNMMFRSRTLSWLFLLSPSPISTPV